MKFVVGGQMDKKVIEGLLKKYSDGNAEVSVMSDIEATMALKNGQADYYFGSCATGAGGALGITMGLMGRDKCISVSMPGKVLSQEEITAAVKAGKIAFGFVNYDAEKVIPLILQAISEK
ncbi:DUF2620 domain-containing protein [Breznakiella homolactica]|uniref:DUF2620 domain-containing protein n=1 Tax=Breznakiella homolactica TaxID=2798577 RepID=A0A7T7XR51_9SPIR|nr:DUF2620 domain-containing protein [Breznakiella homolactica]QQO10912.1 DUF2620 domain-containing protein [Breznakiella homolactica]